MTPLQTILYAAIIAIGFTTLTALFGTYLSHLGYAAKTQPKWIIWLHKVCAYTTVVLWVSTVVLLEWHLQATGAGAKVTFDALFYTHLTSALVFIGCLFAMLRYNGVRNARMHRGIFKAVWPSGAVMVVTGLYLYYFRFAVQ